MEPHHVGKLRKIDTKKKDTGDANQHVTVNEDSKTKSTPTPVELRSPTSTVKTPSLSGEYPCSTCTNKQDEIKVPSQSSPFYGSVTFDPLNGLMEPHFGLPLQFPSAFATFHAPIPVDQRTHEGRYVWDPSGSVRVHPFHHPNTHGLPTSSGAAPPTLPDLSFLQQPRRSNVPATTQASAADIHPAYRLNPYMEHLYGSFHSSPSVSLRGISPVDTRGLSMHPDYLTQMAALSQRGIDVHNTHPPSTAGSTELPFSIESSRLTSPRPTGRQGRKRALSSSPYSDSFDINSMIRFSPNSLVSIMNVSRSSSTSGSYGHLSAGTLSPALNIHPPVGAAHLQQLQHLMRQSSLPGSPFLTHGGLMHQSPGLTPQQSLLMAQAQMPTLLHPLGASKLDSGVDLFPVKDSPVSTVSSTIETASLTSNTESKRAKIKKEPINSSSGGSSNLDDKDSNDPMKDEPGDFIETNCHWRDCAKEFNTQDELVKHINNDHIHANKKSFVCRWKECSRDEKPFKAQYMLVVHMRRHTGEKPHRCTFEGCSKAYSRLENLKTHLRSHTGEKPYMCEFPGCSKAFSNASDRAKHQNRTHSNEKPYICKAPGCTKRYTDPSSLRKHVKTVHGPEFYANKKHKGGDHPSNNPPREDSRDSDRNPGSESSPKSEECSASKAASVSSPSVKSEDPSSPQEHSSPSIDTNVSSEPFLAEHLANDEPISDNNVSTTNGCADILEEREWEIPQGEEIEVPDICIPISASNAVTSSGGNALVHDGNNSRNRLKSRFLFKGSGYSPLPQLPNIGGVQRNNALNFGPANRRMTELKSSSNIINPQRKLPDVNVNSNPALRQTTVQVNPHGNRRDSTTSTISSFYSSMRSEASPHSFGSQLSSRRGSEASQSSARVVAAASPFDPISLGSSRSSSEISNLQGITASMTMHLQRLHRRALATQEMGSTQNLVVQTQNMSIGVNAQGNNQPWMSPSGRYTSLSCHTPQSPHETTNREVRRASDPVQWPECNYRRDNKAASEGSQQSSKRAFNSRQPLPSVGKLSQSKLSVTTDGSSKGSVSEIRHPNEDVVLDECEEDQMVEENKDLVLPDEMVHYLNQVADKTQNEGDGNAIELSEMSPNPVVEVCQQKCTSANPNDISNNDNSNNIGAHHHHHHQPTDSQMRYSSPNLTSINSPQVKTPVHFHPSGEQMMSQQTQNSMVGFAPIQQSVVPYPQNFIHSQSQQNFVLDANHQHFDPSSPVNNQRIISSPQCQNNIIWTQQQIMQNSVPNNLNGTALTNSVMNNNGVNPSGNMQHVVSHHPNNNMNAGNCNNFGSSNFIQNMNPLMMSGGRCPVNVSVQTTRSTCNCQQNFMNGIQIMNQGMGQMPLLMAQGMPQQMGMAAVFTSNQSMSPQQVITDDMANRNSSEMMHQMDCSGLASLNSSMQNNSLMHNGVQMLRSSVGSFNSRPRNAGNNCNCTCNGNCTGNKNSQVFVQQQVNPPMSPVQQMTPSPQQVVMMSPHRCQNCSSSQSEIQCQDISQSTLPPVIKVPTDHRRTCMGMRPDAYQRTLEYVQQCQQNWSVLSPSSNHSSKASVISKASERTDKSMTRSTMSEMSPGCNKVTSTTDNSCITGCEPIGDEKSTLTTRGAISKPASSAIAQKMVGAVRESPQVVPELVEENLVNEGYPMETSNMVINDMNSTLTSLMEETRFLQMIQ